MVDVGGHPMRAAFLLRFDSFIRNHLPVADRIEAGGGESRIWLVDHRRRPWVDEQIRRLLDGRDWELIPASKMRAVVGAWNPDVVFVGQTLRWLDARRFRALRRVVPGAIMVTGYVGAMLDNRPHGFLKGVARRSSFSDLIWTPGEHGKERILGTGLVPPEVRVVASGLPYFDCVRQRVQRLRDSPRPRRDLLFLAQPTYPSSLEERRDVLVRLARLARANPDCRVVVKPRFRQRTNHAHRPRYLYQDLLPELDDRPENLVISHRPIWEAVATARMALTISSTGGIETLLAGVPTYFLRDWCGAENRYGSLFFRESGGVVSIEDLIRGARPEVSRSWAESQFRFDGRNTERLVAACGSLVERKR